MSRKLAATDQHGQYSLPHHSSEHRQTRAQPSRETVPNVARRDSNSDQRFVPVVTLTSPQGHIESSRGEPFPRISHVTATESDHRLPDGWWPIPDSPQQSQSSVGHSSPDRRLSEPQIPERSTGLAIPTDASDQRSRRRRPFVEPESQDFPGQLSVPYLDNLSSSPTAHALIRPPAVVKRKQLRGRLLSDDDDDEVWNISSQFTGSNSEDLESFKLDPKFNNYFAEAARDWQSHTSGRSLSPARAFSRRSGGSISSQNSNVPPDDDGFYCCRASRPTAAGVPPESFFCSACGIVYCKQHWSGELAHSPRRNAAHKHHKIDPKVALWVRQTLNTDCTEQEQAELHLKDDSTFWFGAGCYVDGRAPVFREFGRYAQLMLDTKDLEGAKRYPAFVSFVGETGAGKSSLIKLLIGLKDEGHKSQTPVVGSCNSDSPTSGDVHLYADPKTIRTEQPILYADCEGLHGGSRDPIGAHYSGRRQFGERNHSNRISFDEYNRQRHESSERFICWATTPATSTRSYFVQHLYPRLLYTFSDVVVFVIKNKRAVENVIEQLITWADAVKDASINQPVLPHAIIVLNAAISEDTELWDVTKSTERLLQSLATVIEANPKLVEHVRSWNAIGAKIDSIQALLLCYYSSIRVVRVPDGTDPGIIQQQVYRLYNEITFMTKSSLSTKSDKRMKLSTEGLQPYLQCAIDHFCIDLRRPFDFVKTSFMNSSIPPDFSGNVLKLAIQVMQVWQDRLDGTHLLKHLTFMVASCVMVDAVRRGTLGLEERFFTRYIMHLDEALEELSGNYWPCEYISDKGRCTNGKAGHSKGHQDRDGNITVGNYISSWNLETHRQQFLADVYSNLQYLREQLSDRGKVKKSLEVKTAFQIHKETILQPFYATLGGAGGFVSHSVCFSCLMSPPEHDLPCGHILCTPCIKDCGTARGDCAIDVFSCPLHHDEPFQAQWTMWLKPESAGIRILTLDGGGIRGIAELLSLKCIEDELGSSLRIQSFFDLVVGTSAGGIIALGLATQGWTVAQCIEKFEELVSTAFRKHRIMGFGPLDKLLVARNRGRYQTAPLENMLQKQFGNESLFGGLRTMTSSGDPSPMPRSAVVTATTGGVAFVLANYNRLDLDHHTPYEFLRAETSKEEIKTWEAVRSTSSAPKLFRPYYHSSTRNEFVDGGIRYNNPIKIAWSESRRIWPEIRNIRPDIVVSLGTAYTANKKVKSPGFAQNSFVPSAFGLLLNVAQNAIQDALDCEATWTQFVADQPHDAESKRRLYRINFLLSETPKLDAVSKMRDFRRTIEAELEEKDVEIGQIASRLLATTFYFLEDSPPRKEADHSVTVEGYIRCRFADNTEDLQHLGKVLCERYEQAYRRREVAHTPCFVIEERGREHKAQQVVFDHMRMKAMQSTRTFPLREKIRVHVTNEAAEVDIYLSFLRTPRGRTNNSISGFPKVFATTSAQRDSLHPSLSFSGKREPMRKKAQKPWALPEMRAPSMLARFGKAECPGLATQSEIAMIEQRLKYGMKRDTLFAARFPSYPAELSAGQSDTDHVLKQWRSLPQQELHPISRRSTSDDILGHNTTPRPTRSGFGWFSRFQDARDPPAAADSNTAHPSVSSSPYEMRVGTPTQSRTSVNRFIRHELDSCPVSHSRSTASELDASPETATSRALQPSYLSHQVTSPYGPANDNYYDYDDDLY